MFSRCNNKKVKALISNRDHIKTHGYNGSGPRPEELDSAAKAFWENTAASFNNCLELINTDPEDDHLKQSLINVYHLLMKQPQVRVYRATRIEENPKLLKHFKNQSYKGETESDSITLLIT